MRVVEKEANKEQIDFHYERCKYFTGCCIIATFLLAVISMVEVRLGVSWAVEEVNRSIGLIIFSMLASLCFGSCALRVFLGIAHKRRLRKGYHYMKIEK